MSDIQSEIAAYDEEQRLDRFASFWLPRLISLAIGVILTVAVISAVRAYQTHQNVKRTESLSRIVKNDISFEASNLGKGNGGYKGTHTLLGAIASGIPCAEYPKLISIAKDPFLEGLARIYYAECAGPTNAQTAIKTLNPLIAEGRSGPHFVAASLLKSWYLIQSGDTDQAESTLHHVQKTTLLLGSGYSDFIAYMKIILAQKKESL